MEKIKDINLLAHHEAAHAVISVRLLKRIEYVTIVQDGDIFGHIMPLDPYDVSEEDDGSDEMLEMMDEVMINFAGQIAEDIIYRTPYKQFQIHSDADRENIASLASKYMTEQSEIDLFLAWMYERTRLMLVNDWPAVQAVANALLEKKRLSGNEVMQVYMEFQVNLSRSRRSPTSSGLAP